MDASYLLVLDFEATCADRSSPEPFELGLQEIIELPVALVELRSLQVIDQFGTFVRPTLQPALTAFCTDLTSIEQSDVSGAPEIGDAMAALEEWMASHGADAGNSCVVTCGDWDLLRMWPKQAGHLPALKTPAVFKRWCNIKKVYQEAMGSKPGGMMNMLSGLGIRHVGRHHRGADDVLNIAAIAIRLLELGAAVEPTFTARDAKKEFKRWNRKQIDMASRLARLEDEIEHLPATVPARVREHFDAQREELAESRVRFAATAAVFAA